MSGPIIDLQPLRADPSAEDRFAEVARDLHDQGSETLTLDRAVTIATELIEGCDHAGVTLVHDRGRRLETPAATSEVALLGDRLQYELGEGPCLNSAQHHETTQSLDLRSEHRWPQWSRTVSAELGVRSMLCFQLFTSQRSYGALNLYSETEDAFDEQDQTVGLALAAHVAVALAASREIDTRDAAITRRTTIGQAEGILMERYDIGPDEAFATLRRVSQSSNRKLFDLAHELVRTRLTPR